MDNEVVARLVALIVAKDVGQVVGAFLGEADHALLEVGVQQRQPHAGLAKRLKIPDVVTAPVVEVAPVVDFELTTDGDAVYQTVKHFAAVDQELGVAHAVVVVSGLGVVVGPECKAHPAPCRKLVADGPLRTLDLGDRRSETESLLGTTPIEDAFALDWTSHEGVGLGCYSVADEGRQFAHGVAQHPGLGVVQFQVQVGTRGVARIATDGYEVASLDRKLHRRKGHRQGVSGPSALQLSFVPVSKMSEVTIYAGLAVRMTDVDGVAKTIHVDRQSADVAVGNGIDGFALLIVRLDIQSTMEVERARLTKVASQRDIIVNGRPIGHLTIADRLGIVSATACQ